MAAMYYNFDGFIKGGMTDLVIIIGAVLSVGVLLIIHGTIFKTRWGINPASQIECTRCHKMYPQVRIPHNLRQKLWGGWTCDRCGLEVDKWNRPISKPTSPLE